MYRQTKRLTYFCHNSILPRKLTINAGIIKVNEEVKYALNAGKPVVALESTIITHGMPYPTNIECALDVEQIVRKEGAIPATIAIVKGKIKVGLIEDELKFLGDIKSSNPFKTSRRDIPYVVSNKLNGGTTVSGTLIVANKTHIPIFATGGIGGVHRGAHKTFDISADLIELGKCGVAVVSSGVKSILDIPKTLEYLETQGVFVATFGDNNEFPAFYLRTSGSKAPYSVKTAMEAAKIIKSSMDLDMQSGMLFAVPVPEESALFPEIINNAIEEALKSVKSDLNVMGKNVTPFLLQQVAKITKGKSLDTNIALIKNNAKTAAKIAVVLAELRAASNETDVDNLERVKGRPVIIGGSNLDCSATLTASEIKVGQNKTQY
ncbi:hypothetical protein NQ317_017682 [Molorchus minor]|uniref:Pseudouridine-5'-phosphate glycosidase n=1 Tax=Molorchus minor TaxID=1323400 RepID=A0ABQ9JMS4_9CUCU|nr:hypothetical protein NQ317_017682 [Molorchus minor]